MSNECLEIDQLEHGLSRYAGKHSLQGEQRWIWRPGSGDQKNLHRKIVLRSERLELWLVCPGNIQSWIQGFKTLSKYWYGYRYLKVLLIVKRRLNRKGFPSTCGWFGHTFQSDGSRFVKKSSLRETVWKTCWWHIFEWGS